MGCQHETVVVYTTEIVTQDYHRPSKDWIGPAEHPNTPLSVDHILCVECGAVLTDQLKQEINMGTA